MTTYVFQSDPKTRHHVFRRDDHVLVNGAAVAVRALDKHHYLVRTDAALAHVHAAVYGDTVYLQLDGRTCVIQHIDPARSQAAGLEPGGVTAPMPGLVVRWMIEPGCSVQTGDALLVIESMKLQRTIEAPHAGLLEDLPFKAGQTFERGAVLAHIHPQETVA